MATNDADEGGAGDDWLGGGPNDHEPDTLTGDADAGDFVLDNPDRYSDVSINDRDMLQFIRYWSWRDGSSHRWSSTFMWDR